MTEKWLDTAIVDRARVEETFHDARAKSMRLDELLVRESFESPTAVENRYALKALGGPEGIKGKRLLDLGCGAGETSVFFAMQGAIVTAADVSNEMLQMAQALAQRHGVEMKTVKLMAEAMPFDAGAFDCVYGNGVLHHVELGPALSEISRVLAPGGRASFIEPLSHNPAIKVYRHLARDVPTPTEQPFAYRSLRLIKRYFPSMTQTKSFGSSV